MVQECGARAEATMGLLARTLQISYQGSLLQMKFSLLSLPCKYI